MPSRLIKESIRTSKTVNAMTDFQFRLWVYLITYVDDYGCGSADPELVKGLVFPRRKRVSEMDIGKALADLAGMGCISLYDVDGESYFCFPNWSDHQRVQAKRHKYPMPENGKIKSTVIHGELPSVTVSDGELPPISVSISESISESESVSESVSPQAREGEHTQAVQAFSPPTAEAVRAYAASLSKTMDAQGFVDFYASKGWMVGASQMRDWKAAVRRWKDGPCTGASRPTKRVREQQYEQREYAEDSGLPDWMNEKIRELNAK